jgi:hypothetical protein
VCLGVRYPSGISEQIFFLIVGLCILLRVLPLDSCGFLYVGRPLWREDGCVVYSCWWARQCSLSRVLVPLSSLPYFTASNFRLPPHLEGQVPVLISPKGQGCPRQWVIHETVEVDFATNGQSVSSSWCRWPDFKLSLVR